MCFVKVLLERRKNYARDNARIETKNIRFSKANGK